MSAGHIRPRGPGAWELKYDIGRDPKTGERLTRYATVRGTRRDAERKLRELLAAVDRGEHVERSKLTVAEHVRARIAQWQASGRISVGTAERYGQLLQWCIAPHIGEIRLQKLTTLDLETWHTALLASGRRRNGKGVSGYTVRNAHRVLSKALAEGVRHKLLLRNVAEIQRAPRVKAKEIEILTSDQINTTMARLEGHELHAAVVVSLYCGLRRGELLALRWSHIDLNAAVPVLRVREALEETKAQGIRVKEPKSEAGRREISLPVIAITVLRDHRRRQLELRMALGMGKMPEDTLVFPDPLTGGHMSPLSLSLRWGRTVKRLGLPKVGWHALRHTHASMLIDAGVDVVKVSKRLGHASPTVTLSTYAHKFSTDDRACAQAIDAALGGMK